MAVVRITSVKSGLVLDVTGGSIDPLARVIQFPAHDENPDNQLWVLEHVTQPDGAVRIVNVNSGLVLDVEGGSSAPLAPIIQFPAHDADPENQLWTIQAFGAGSRIVNVKSGLVLDVQSGSVDPLAPIIQFPAHDVDPDNQLWTFVTFP